jgi:heme-degrading monooxygenase HmoA
MLFAVTVRKQEGQYYLFPKVSYSEHYFGDLVYELKHLRMIIVHDIFICKPGNASKLAKMFKEAMAGNKELVNILTDMTGQYNRVIMVSQYENLSAYEQSWEKYMQNSEEMKRMQEKMEGYQDMFMTGSREIYKVW